MISHDIALPISVIPGFVERTDAWLAQCAPGVRISKFGHPGDGNLHYNVHAPAGLDSRACLQQREDDIRDGVYESAHRAGSTFSAEHGIGSLKLGWMSAFKSAAEIGMMRAIKQTLDPRLIMNPHRVLPNVPHFS